MAKELRESRIDAIKVIYSCSMSGDSVVDVFSNIVEDEDPIALKYSLEVMKNKKEIDNIISNTLINYTINRLNQVDVAIIELAVYEMQTGTPVEVAINEALEITKIYTDQGDKKQVAFNNRLLDNIRKKL